MSKSKGQKSKDKETTKLLTFQGAYIVVKGRKFHFLLLLVAALIIRIGILASIRTTENVRLARNGKLTKAFVTKVQDVGAKGTTYVTFKYEVNGVTYKTEQSNEPVKPGDSVYLVYLDGSPEVCRTYRFISENYSTDIHLPE